MMRLGLRSRNTPGELKLLAGAGGLLLVAAVATLAAPLDRSVRLWRQISAASVQERALTDELAPLHEWLMPEFAAAPRRILGGSQSPGAVPELLDRLSALGEDCAVKVTGMSPRVSAPRRLPAAEALPVDSAAPPPFAILTVEIEARGSFVQLGRYFEEVARLDVPLTVRSLRLAPARTAGEPVKAQFTLAGWVIVAPDPTGMDAPPSTLREADPDEAA